MPHPPIPDITLPDIYALSPEMLFSRGITLLLLDLDNTLVPYGVDTAPVRLRNWIDSMKKSGMELYILSNNHGPRPQSFSKQLNLDYTNKAKKPSTKKLLAVLNEKQIPPKNAAIIGDQIYTDVLCGKRAGLLTIAVRPISMKNPILFLRYGLEYPFRRMGRKRKNQCQT